MNYPLILVLTAQTYINKKDIMQRKIIAVFFTMFAPIHGNLS